MKRVSGMVVILCLAWQMVGCSTAAVSPPAAVPVATLAPGTAVAAPTLPPATKKAPPGFPLCEGMQKLTQPVQFDWPNLAEHKQDFFRSQWTYYSCEEPLASVAALYQQDLPQPPYSMEETNWLERPEGILGVYFSQTGAWDYIWFIPQPDDAQKSYVIIAETFAYVEC